MKSLWLTAAVIFLAAFSVSAEEETSKAPVSAVQREGMPLSAAEPEAPKTPWQRAVYFFDKEQFEEARKATEEVLAQKPDSPEANEMHTQVLAALQEWDAVVASAHKTLAIAPNNANATVLLGYAHYRKAEYEKAAEYFEKAMALGRVTDEFMIDLTATYLALKNYDKALETAKKSVELQPEFPIPHFFLGRAYVDSQKYDLAVEPLKKCLQLLDYEPAWEYLGLAYIGLGDGKKAKQTFEELLKKYPENAFAKEKLEEIRGNRFSIFKK